ncbi:MAG: prolipoprotein diacylglyceryl transferase [Chloroflexota bacterium]
MSAIPIPIDPVAVRIGPLVLTWHGIFTAVGILVGMYCAAWLAPVVGLVEDAVWSAAWWVIGGGIVGARLLFAAEHLEFFLAEPWRLVLINEGGISVFGAVLGGMAGGAFWARRSGVSPARLLDVAAPGFLLGQAIGRIGDVINGEHLGAHAPGLPWAVVYTHPDTLGEIGVPVHLAVGYELLWDLAAGVLVVWLLRRRFVSPTGQGRRLPPGVALWTAVFLYSLGRLWVGFFRLDLQVALGLGLAQLIGLCLMPIALAGIWLSLRRPARLA